MLKLCVVAIGILSTSAQAIVTRHDVEPAHYLANSKEFAPLATFYFDGAHGTLIEPEWIVTAAHATFCVTPNRYVKVGNQLRKVKNTYVHKQYQPGKSHDIALVELVSAVEDVTPAKRYKQSDELGKTLWFIGIGGTGNGLTGETVNSYDNQQVLRKAHNKVSEVQGPLIKFKFDKEKDALPLEGVSGGGDSGGPAYVRDADAVYLLGVSSRFEGAGIGKYGITEIYTRISFFNTWIDQIMAGEDVAKYSLPKLPTVYLPAGLTQSNLQSICEQINWSSEGDL
ncbi:trypsin-like serine protease [Pseudoalteromonas sp. SMS1]|uniref:trypsin-like serine protease n=1 Tax=Pseudoalteromonas sp. SMS1 TaxID=2908894 RepID=UPI001F236141|nr:trypsin-like serine protease [Pseudoalteromonas sp. SMS1]MCF2856987.1 trypsin-like serine protease [Pseudoalteromonas sp. SMS1]